MSKKKIFNKLGKTVKQKAGEIVKEYADKAKDKVGDLGTEYADDMKSRASRFIDELMNKGTQKIVSRLGKNPQNDNQNPEDPRLHEEEIEADHYNEPKKNRVGEYMTDKDDDTFVGGISSDLLNTGLKGLANPGEALAVVDNLVQIAGEVKKFREVQETKRATIEAERQAVISKIRAQRELLIKYLDKTFDERKENFNKLFDVIDDALVKDNIQQLSMGLNSFNELATSSPFKDLANIEQIGKALEDKNHEWDF